MRTFSILLALLAAGAAHAHPGHVAAVDGHSHYVALAAGIGAVVVLAAVLAPRLRRWLAAARDRRRNAG